MWCGPLIPFLYLHQVGLALTRYSIAETSPRRTKPLSSSLPPTRQNQFYAAWKSTPGLPDNTHHREELIDRSLVIFIHFLHPSSSFPLPTHPESMDSLSRSSFPSHFGSNPRSFPTPQPRSPMSPCQHRRPPTTLYPVA